jgi:ubiquinone/menaquinone biosynthesis C-methylase UbiE
MRALKYLSYFIGLPIIGFACMALIFPLTRAAHDGGMFGMVLGLLLGQALFSLLLLDFKWYYCILFGIATGVLTVWAAYSVNGILMYSPDGISIKYNSIVTALAPKDSYGYPNEEKVLEWTFFITFLSTSVIAWESTNRAGKFLIRRRSFGSNTDLGQINELTKIAYDKTADKYHDHFKDEVSQKEYDRLLLDRFSDSLSGSSLICDAGCGPSAHIGRYLADKGHKVTGIDISQKCIDIASSHNPQMNFTTVDMMNTGFEDDSFDAIVAFYSIIYTPKKYVPGIFAEFNRILKRNGKLLVVVKKGLTEGLIDDEWYEGNEVYFTHFLENEVKEYFLDSGFVVESFETRKPYDFEFKVERIYAIGSKQS